MDYTYYYSDRLSFGVICERALPTYLKIQGALFSPYMHYTLYIRSMYVRLIKQTTLIEIERIL